MAKRTVPTPTVGENFDKLPEGAKRAVMEAVEYGREMARREKDPFESMRPAVDWEGSRLKLPAEPQKMPYRTGSRWLTALADEEESTISIEEPINAFVLEGALAFSKALQRMFGGATSEAKQTFFGEVPPRMYNIETDVNESMNVLWGVFKIPGVDDSKIETGITEKNGRTIFCIRGEIRKKYQNIIHELAELTRQIVKDESIYKGKAITLGNTDGKIDFENPPTFLDVSNPGTVIFPEKLDQSIRANIFEVIEETERCKLHGIPLRRGVLLYGPPGCGKTLLGSNTAKKATDNGWTFITVTNASAFKTAIQFAKNYQPAVVFVEDINRIMAGKRTAAFDEILNTIQGISSNKAEQLIVMVTTNDVQDINTVALRPGRFSALLHIEPPNEEAVIRLLRHYGGTLIETKDSLKESAKALAGEIPATIEEAVIRAKLYALSRDKENDPLLIDTDIAFAAEDLLPHRKLLKAEQQAETLEQRLASGIIEAVKKSIDESDVMTKVKEVHNHIFQ